MWGITFFWWEVRTSKVAEECTSWKERVGFAKVAIIFVFFQIKMGEIKHVSALGQNFAVFRGEESNQIHVLDAYCSHLGADLTAGGKYVPNLRFEFSANFYTCNCHFSCNFTGRVIGDKIQCPFHHWQCKYRSNAFTYFHPIDISILQNFFQSMVKVGNACRVVPIKSAIRPPFILGTASKSMDWSSFGTTLTGWLLNGLPSPYQRLTARYGLTKAEMSTTLVLTYKTSMKMGQVSLAIL